MTESAGTRLDPRFSQLFWYEELHVVFLQHRRDHGGFCPSVTLMVPEEQHLLEDAAREAHARRARVLLLCDTAERALEIKERARRLLPEHREVSIERAAAGK
jgi:hypothetical protein